MSNLVFRKMEQADVATVAQIEKDCFSIPWSIDSITEELENTFSRFYVLEADCKTVGYIGSHNVLGEVYITNVAVFKNARGTGYGKALVNHLLSEMKKENADFVTLEVRKSNEIAISLYKKTGFSEVGVRKDFYECPREDAILMTYYYNKG